MSQNISLWGGNYTNVPGLTVPKTGGGTSTFYDVSDTTASASDVVSGKYFYTSSGVKTQGSASSGWTVASTSKTSSSNSTSISFSGLSGEPKFFFIQQTANISLTSTSSSTRYVASVFFDGTSMSGVYFRLSSNRAANTSYDSSDYTKSYSNGTLTISSNSSSTGGYFRSGVSYKLVYCY